MRSERMAPGEIVAGGYERLPGAVLLAPVRLDGRSLAKGCRLNRELAALLRDAAGQGGLTAPLRLAWPDIDDLHEDDAALRLARAVAGSGVRVGAPRQSRVDLTAATDGVLRVNVPALAQLNRIDPLEVFTLFHGQAVRSGDTVAAVKVAPHLVAGSVVAAGEVVARNAAPLVDVAAYLPLAVAALAAESLAADALERFELAARTKVTSLGGRFAGVIQVSADDPAEATARLRDTLRQLAVERGIPLLLVGGVSAGDPLSPFYSALESLGGSILRRGVPAHPGSMIWLAALAETILLGLPQCGMFSMATAADLVLPRLLTGERVSPDTLADLGHGGLLGKEMRFRFPEYARYLDSPA
jgi:molybdopterin biosynthesis enzyme